MAWNTLNRNLPSYDPQAPALLSAALKDKIREFFPRYETRRAVLLPALHIVQQRYGWISPQAMKEIAELLEIHPAEVFDVVSFYTHFTDHPTGRKRLLVCRSLSCELLGGRKLLAALEQHLGVSEHGTSADGRYTLETEECLAACDYAPCMMINERMHKNLDPAQVAELLDDPHNDRLSTPRSALFDPPADDELQVVETTSDVREMKDSD